MKRASRGKAGAGTGEPAPKKAAEDKTVLPRSATPRAQPPLGARGFKALSWNVAGLRALLSSAAGSAALARLVEAEAPDLLCLQEHKLQTQHVADAESGLRALLGPAYGSYYWAVSTDKAGYSGVCAILRGPAASFVGAVSRPPSAPATAKAGAPAPATTAAVEWGAAGAVLSHSQGLGPAGAHAGEGRVLTLSFASFSCCCVYSPNSGDKLQRLEHRVGGWEVDARAHAAALQTGAKALLWGGDLNVAHRDADIWNVGAAHIKKQAGCTPAERAAFGQLCANAELVDTLVAMHPDARHVYSYWSTRAQNRPWNRGLRLDYWLISAAAAAPRQAGEAAAGPAAPGGVRLVESFVLEGATPGVSDHAPVGVTIALPEV